MLGYKLRVPESGRLMNFLRWDQPVDPLVWQPHETMFERMSAAGIAVTHVSSPRFADSGLTRSVFRGARFSGAEAVDQQARQAIEALNTAERTFVYLYYRDLDFIGHTSGVGSPRWREELAFVDGLVQRLAEQLPRDATLFVTADHGMVGVPDERKIDVDPDFELRAGVALLGGEARARHVYATSGAARDVLAIWEERLDGIAAVRRTEADHGRRLVRPAPRWTTMWPRGERCGARGQLAHLVQPVLGQSVRRPARPRRPWARGPLAAEAPRAISLASAQFTGPSPELISD